MSEKTPPTPTPTALPAGGVSRLKRVLEFTDIPNSTWWDNMKEGRLPKPIGYRGKMPYWSNDEVIEAISPDGVFFS